MSALDTQSERGKGLSSVFFPKSVAVVGASADSEKQGHKYVASVLHQGFKGPVYAVNPRREPVLGVPGYASVEEIPGPVEYVISCVPSGSALDLIDQCAAKGVKAIQFFTAQFSETGRADKAGLEQAMLSRARAGGVRILGPNCMGVYHPVGGLGFKLFPKEPGRTSILSQSGGNAVELILSLYPRGVRFGKVVSFGNALDINETELMWYLANDNETDVVGVYIEGPRDGRGFFRATAEAAKRKPVVLLKGGRTAGGTRAVRSHTASLAGSDHIWQALSSQVGATLVETIEELMDALVVFSLCRAPAGFRVVVVGGGGGTSVESADECDRAGLVLEPVPDSVRAALRHRVPNLWDWIGNPADGSILGGSGLEYGDLFRLFDASGAYDMFIANLDLWRMDRPEGVAVTEKALIGTIEALKSTGKPSAVVIRDSVSEEPWRSQALAAFRRMAWTSGIAPFPTIRRAARSMQKLAAYYVARSATNQGYQLSGGRDSLI